MKAAELKQGRLKAGLTQVQAASRLEVSQPYLSQLERDLRKTTPRVARAAAKLYGLPPTVLPKPQALPRGQVNPDKLTRELAALGYPGYSHVRPGPPVNPAVLALEVLSQDDLDRRLAESLPWVFVRYPHLDWDWLVTQAKVRNLQNRLGFLVAVAREVSERAADCSDAALRLRQVEQELESARLTAETTLSRDTMPSAERKWLRQNRPPEAERWNVLTTMTAQQLTYGG